MVDCPRLQVLIRRRYGASRNGFPLRRIPAYRPYNPIITLYTEISSIN